MPLPLIDSPIPNDHGDRLSVLGRAASGPNTTATAAGLFGLRPRPVRLRVEQFSRKRSPRGRFEAVATIYSGTGTVVMRGKNRAERLPNASRIPPRRGPFMRAVLGTQPLLSNACSRPVRWGATRMARRAEVWAIWTRRAKAFW